MEAAAAPWWIWRIAALEVAVLLVAAAGLT
jgi:hypothetical protein